MGRQFARLDVRHRFSRDVVLARGANHHEYPQRAALQHGAQALVADFDKLLEAKQYQQAYDLAKSDESFLGRVLAAGMAKIFQGYDQAIESMQGIGEEENMRVEHRLSYLALIGSIAPMVGLLGTVDGMIMSFKVIANTTTGAPDPQSLAEGVATALFTTLVGLLLAIPAIGAYNILRNKVARNVFEIGVVSDELMSRFKKPQAV